MIKTFTPMRNPPYAIAMKKSDQIRSSWNIFLYRFLKKIVTIATNHVQYPMNISKDFLLMIFVTTKSSCPKIPKRYL